MSSKLNTPEGVCKDAKKLLDVKSINLTPKEALKQRLSILRQPITIQALEDTLSTTIKHDATNKKICFLAMLLNYTEEDQFNIGFNAESSTGKSYIPLELAAFFPQEDVKYIAYSSPTSFFYDFGKWNEEEEITEVNWHQQIIIFLDQPHDMLLQRMRPILSKDRKDMIYKTTDRNKRGSNRTRNIKVIGYFTTIFCSANPSNSEQEKTRMLLLSPEIASKKLKASINLLADKLADRKRFREELEADPQRNWLRTRVHAVKNADIHQILIPEEMKAVLVQRFLKDHPYLIPRHQRDFPRLIGLCKAWALLNYQSRIRHEEDNHNIYLTQEDIDVGYQLYHEISRANELGLSPEIYNFYEAIFTKGNGPLSKKDIRQKDYKAFHKTIGKKRLKNFLDQLLSVGLIDEETNPDDRREKLYSACLHPSGHISPSEPSSTLIKFERYIASHGEVGHLKVLNDLNIDEDTLQALMTSTRRVRHSVTGRTLIYEGDIT